MSSRQKKHHAAGPGISRGHGWPIDDQARELRPSPPQQASIAVLPFANMSGDPEQEYFADGMVEEIITELSRTRWLFVIARNSSFSYEGQSPDVRQVGRELGVRYLLKARCAKIADEYGSRHS